MSQHEQQTYIKIVEQIWRDTHAPVTAVAVANRAYISDRWARKRLGDIEKLGLLHRVGSRKGWLPIAC